MSRPLHPLAIKAIEEWIETLPSAPRQDAAHAGRDWRQVGAAFNGTSFSDGVRSRGVSGSVERAVEYLRWNVSDKDWFLRPGPALIRRLRHAALQDIATRELTKAEYSALYAEMAKREIGWTTGGRLGGRLLDVNARITRRRLAAQRLLVADDRAEQAETATDEVVRPYLERIGEALR